MIDLVRSSGLMLESQAGRSVGYRQALEYLKAAWGFPHQSQSEARQEEKHICVTQVRDCRLLNIPVSLLCYCIYR